MSTLPTLQALINNQPKANPVYIKPYRALNGIQADAVLEEEHEDELVVTEHPVEQGATITDHAYKLPARVTLTYGWSMGSPQNVGSDITFLKDIYNKFLQLQNARTLFAIYTGKRTYQNMILQAIRIDTTRETENSILVRATCREVLLATTQTITVPNPNNMTNPQNNAPTLNSGQVGLIPGSNYNPNGGSN